MILNILVLLSGLGTIVSCCSSGNFNCTSGECVPAQKLCDFRENCEDGSDEEFCGSCNFENHSCGWEDTSYSSYSWRRQMVNTSVPGQDHTTGTPWGYVMCIDGEESNLFSEAILEYPVNQLAALGCQISFWYHIYEDNPSPISSSSLKVKMIRGTVERNLLEISKRETDGWENATAFIGNQPGGYKLLISYEPSFGEKKDVMLDDISFENCAEGDVPEESDNLSCDFEKDTCSWYHDYTASLLWKRNNGAYEDLTGNGYFMLIKANNQLDISSTARLISFPKPAGQTICVSFRYYIFGNSIGSLRFITKHSGEPETVVWMRSGTQGNKWRFADLTFNSDRPIQFIIEAVVGGTQGSIAIDDVVVAASLNGSCPPERECTFQGSLCGMQPHPSANFSWDRITGVSQPANSSGPTKDHTLGTEQGYYLSAGLWKHSVGTRGAMMALMEPTPLDGECLMFWYYMEGTGVGELSVYLQTDSQENATKLWTRVGDQGSHWRHGRVTLYNPQSNYQVVFEAIAGDEPMRDIAIDDLTVLNGVCPPPGFCDFEMDFCGWVNNPPAESDVEWDWLSGQSDAQLIPRRDHSTNSPLGHFAFLWPSKPEKEEFAQLESESMEAVESGCIEIWHHAEGWRIGPSAIILTVFLSEAGVLHPLFSTNGYMNSTWFQDRVNYNSSSLHKIILQARRPVGNSESFALDDIHIIRGKSCEDLIPTTTNPPTTTTSAPPSNMDCSFEKGLCNWVQEDTDDINWTLSNGLQEEGLWNGPQYDHTVDSGQGFFLLVNGSGSKDGDKAVTSVSVSHLWPQSCVQFWYYMLGPSVSTLNLLIQTSSSEKLVWTRQGTQNPEWIKAQVAVSLTDALQIQFSGQRNIHSHGFIAIDDITVRAGSCSYQNECGFDSDWCGFENRLVDRGHWNRTRGANHHVDKTYGTENGFYMSVMTSVSEQSETAELLSPVYSSDTEMCVRFWYMLPAETSSYLSVHVLRSGELGDVLWRRSGFPSKHWEVAEVTVSSPAPFNVAFQSVHVPGTNGTVKIDDFSVRNGACSAPASCDFESGQCTWVKVHTEDGHEWVMSHGGSHGPPMDHTTQTSDGWFLLSSALHQGQHSVAQVVSEWIQLQDTPCCLTFWYHMGSSDSGTLRLFAHSDPAGETLMFHSNSSGSSWTRFSQSVYMTQPFQLMIEAESNNKGFIAIDDISLTEGLCPENETRGFEGCSFENGTCDWQDSSFGQVQWVRGRNGTLDSGPSVDNTLGTELGWYMGLEADRGEEMSPAALQSPIMKEASSTCTLHFYFNMHGEESELKVLLKKGPRITTLWWLAGNSGDLWQHSNVVIGRVPHDFTLLFEASTNFNKPGHVAVDDIDFTNCSLPAEPQSCSGNTFMCNNSACIDPSHVCDFSDDCGDRSDEIDCEKQGVVERCNFEQGLCSWAHSDVDTPEGDWTRQAGQEGWPRHGPPRDHTDNLATGHYITPGSHLTARGQISEILSKTLLPSFNCTVRFFYFSMSDDSAQLTAKSRTLKSGVDDEMLWIRGSSHSYNWQRAKVTFSSSVISKIAFRYELGDTERGLVALDDISFSRECNFDPENSKLPETLPTSSPHTPPVTTTPMNPCQDNEFFCRRSAGKVCIPVMLQCNYHPDCPEGEDETGCGSCTFENDQCLWSDASDGPAKWQRQKASSNTEPPEDHTIQTGFYMTVNLSQGSTQTEAKLLSPQLKPSSPYCQLLFHFHISAESTGSLRVLMQQAEGGEAILWSRSHNTVSHWALAQMPIGLFQQTYKIWFSSISKATGPISSPGDHVVAVDDISFINCETTYEPPALSSYGCTFEDGLCVWVQGAEDELDWSSGSGPTETPNTGPTADHTTGTGKYLYIESSHPSEKENTAQLKSLLLPPAGENGYCFTFWYHMFGATVGSLKMLLKSADSSNKILVWQQSGSQGDEWLLVQSHVTLQRVHQVILEATVGGEAGDIAIDDISFIHGPCPDSDLCDFEEGSCSWQQEASDDFDWIRKWGSTLNPNTGPESDHTTNTPKGHYYYLPSSMEDQAGQKALMSSPLYSESKGSCLQLWYHMYGKGMGTLNVYQQSLDGKEVLIFSQTGDQGRLWRFAQAELLPRIQPYRIVVEGVKTGPTLEGDMAFDDVHLTDAQCPPHGFCDFESSFCSWSNLGGRVDQGDWLLGAGASPNPNTGPTVDHTTNSSNGHYIYVDSSVGEWGDTSYLVSDVFQPSSRGHCLTFWYHMYGSHIGTLNVYINDRKMHAGGNEEGYLKWTKAGNSGDQWLQDSVYIKHEEAFWFVFVYERGKSIGGDVALDDITIQPSSCYSEPSVFPSNNSNALYAGLAVGLMLLIGITISIFLFMLNRKWKSRNTLTITNNEVPREISMFDMSDHTQHDTQPNYTSDFSFFNKLYDPSAHTEALSDA
ncbi:PREDICTED: MAM and LDL-receptor class A domain-containing protein 2-like [Poecilia mexicana]|uniref:MAM and LDL-receptor class A domain-containing protein 2-like n=2 Tax=Poecilia mexicana TaxID=48701 RepID=UPI00072DD19D|nr:PREDICTED: MAM and LDL-receptor class A domain-containing protein 2-like [Poecilia mexicana]